MLLGELSLDGGDPPGPRGAADCRGARGGRVCAHPAAGANRGRGRRGRRGCGVFAVATLADAVGGAERAGPRSWRATERSRRRAPPRSVGRDFADVRGQAAGAPRPRDRGGRRAQPAARRAAGRGQDDDGAARAGDAAADDLRRGARVDARSTRSRGCLPPGAGLLGATALPRAAPHRSRTSALVGGGSRAASRRDQPRAQRRAVSRRDARVQPRTCSRCCASRSRRARCSIARAARTVTLPRALRPRRRDEPVPVRLPRRPGAAVPVHAAPGRALRGTALGPAARPDRPDRGGARPAGAELAAVAGGEPSPTSAPGSWPPATARWRATTA